MDDRFYTIQSQQDKCTCDLCKEINGSKIDELTSNVYMQELAIACENENGCRCYLQRRLFQ